MTNIVTAFDLNWRSDQLSLPDLQLTEDKNIDIDIVNESHNLWPEIKKSIADTSFLQMQENDLRLEINNIGKFRALNGNKIAWDKFDDQVNNKDIRTFLQGSMFGAILIQRDLILMHGNALEKNGKAIVCMGFSGSGKSTLAYTLIKNGWKFIADDLVAINNKGYILKGIPRLKLWEDCLNVFGLKKRDLDSVRNNLNKYIFRPEDEFLVKENIKLSAFYLINRFSRMSRHNEDKYIKQVNDEKNKLLFLRNNLYRPRFVRGLAKEGNIFIHLAKLQREIPVSILNLPPKLDLLMDWAKKIDL